MFQRVLDDSAQIRSTLQGFGSVLTDMAQVLDVAALREELLGADGRVGEVQDRFTAPLAELQQAAAVSPPSWTTLCCTGPAPEASTSLFSRRWKPSREK